MAPILEEVISEESDELPQNRSLTKEDLQSFLLSFVISQKEFNPEKLEAEAKKMNMQNENGVQYPVNFHEWIHLLGKETSILSYLHDFLSRFTKNPVSNTQTAIAREFCEVIYPAFCQMNWDDFLVFLAKHETNYLVLQSFTPFTIPSLFRLS